MANIGHITLKAETEGVNKEFKISELLISLI